MDTRDNASPSSARAELRVDAANHGVYVRGRWQALGARELHLIEVLLAAHGEVVSGPVLLAHVWSQDAGADLTTLRSAVRRLQARLGARELIETIGGEGYRLNLASRAKF